MSHTTMHWLSVCGWLLLSFFLSGMEAGVFELSRLRVRQMARKGNGNARRLLGYMDRPEDFLWTILVGNTMANFSAVVLLLGDLRQWSLGSEALFLGLLLVTGLAIYLTCELLPKRLFQKFPNRLCMHLVGVFGGVHLVLSPLVYLVGRFAELLLRITGDRALSGRLFANRDELKAMIQGSAGGLSKTERSLIGRILDAQSLTVGRVARPLEKSVTLSAAMPVSAVLEAGRQGSHTRLPVWNHDGAGRRIEGIVSLKDLLHAEPDPARTRVRDWLRPALFLDESLRIEEALRVFQRSGQHMAIVRGINGAETGLVTLSDIFRALFLEVQA
jgi:CBS domain containing-hemolysin-like protein